MIKFSVLIITHRREELLIKCLESFQIAPENWQLILVANGIELSEKIDSKARSICHEYTPVYLTEIQKPGRARNLALEYIKYDWVFLLDDDAYLPNDYFQKFNSILARHHFDVLGGTDAPAPLMNSFASSLALTLGSPLCTGMTHTRHQIRKSEIKRATEETLTSCNLWIKTKLLINYKFPENFIRGEETMLILDLDLNGAVILFSPNLYVYHHRREKIKDLIKPTFYSGYYRSRVMRSQKGKVSSLFWLPAIFVLLHLTFLWNMLAFLEMAKIYTILIAAISLLIVQRAGRLGLFFKVFLLHYIIVFIYGVGFIAERMGFPWKSTQ